MAKSAVANEVLKFFIKKAWPFFKEYVWPIMREWVISVFTEAMTRLKERLFAETDKSNSNVAEQAESNANEAAAQARSATSTAERDKYEAVEQVWRQVAEQLRQENEMLKERLGKLTEASTTEINAEITNASPAIETTADQTVLAMGDRRVSLTALPDKLD